MKFNKRINRNKNYSKKSIILFAIMFIGLGFAALSATLGINGLAKIGHISFDVHFENVSVNPESMEAEKDATINPSDNTQIDFSLVLTKPGEYYEFAADIVNSGTLDAYLSSIELLGLDEDKQKFLGVDLSYMDGGMISVDDLLPSGARERIRVKVEFLYDINNEDLPAEGTEVELSLNLTYTQDSGKRDDRLYSKVVAMSEGLDNVPSRYVDHSSGIDFLSIPSDYNGYGVYLRAGTENDTYPIYYYRGLAEPDANGIEDYLDNNVLFGGYCWKIVRTTEQGGTKLLYNGVPRKVYENEKLDEDEYKIITQSFINKNPKMEKAPDYNFDVNTKWWRSNMHWDDTVALIRFSVSSAGEYVLDYLIASEENYDKAYVYVNGKKILDGISGLDYSQVYLGYLTNSDVIEIRYDKDSYDYGYADGFEFSLGKVTSKPMMSCNNYFQSSQLSTKSTFNTSDTALADVGYMYGERYEPITWEDEPFIYGRDVTYNDGVYALTDVTSESTLADNAGTRHYTCKLTTNATCSTVYYVHGLGDLPSPKSNLVTPAVGSAYQVFAIALTNGETIETVYEKSFRNDNDSEVKKVVDAWFEENLLHEEEKLEDAVWCNDRSIAFGGYLKNDDVWSTTYFGINRFYLPEPESMGISTYGSSIYDNMNLQLKDTITCPNKNDRFTKSDTTIGNGKLDYSVGLLTFEETVTTGLLYYELYYELGNLTMSPLTAYPSWDNGIALFDEEGEETGDVEWFPNKYGVRPSVVLKNEIKVLRGDGTVTNPYVITSGHILIQELLPNIKR